MGGKLPSGDQALLLLMIAEVKISNRRLTEAACGYPMDYGDDEQLLVNIRRHLLANDRDVLRLRKLVKL